jgi:hypothetical protein
MVDDEGSTFQETLARIDPRGRKRLTAEFSRPRGSSPRGYAARRAVSLRLTGAANSTTPPPAAAPPGRVAAKVQDLWITNVQPPRLPTEQPH